jgi:hypothetical protein
LLEAGEGMEEDRDCAERYALEIDEFEENRNGQ